MQQNSAGSVPSALGVEQNLHKSPARAWVAQLEQMTGKRQLIKDNMDGALRKTLKDQANQASRHDRVRVRSLAAGCAGVWNSQTCDAGAGAAHAAIVQGNDHIGQLLTD